jgi:predicted nucleic acid-binding protein
MKSFFLDTNVIIDFLADRKPFAEAAAHLFSLALDNKLKIYCSAISFNNIYYLIRQTHTHSITVGLLDEIFEMTEIISVGEKIINQSLKSDFRDFEDAIQYYCALTIIRMDCIITRNTKDFKKSRIPVLSPIEALALF